MRKTLLALLLGSLAVPLSAALAAQLLADASTNIEPETPAPAAPTKVVPPPSNASPEVTQAAQEEILRRQAAQIAGRALLDEGQKLYYDGRYEEATVKLEQAVRIIPRAKATEVDYTRALHALTDSYYKLGTAAFRAGDNTRARAFAMKALQYDPKNRNAEILLVNIRKVEAGGKSAMKAEQPPATRLDRTPEFRAKRDDVGRLFREGKILMNSGQYDEAEKRFQEVLLLDPYNDDAHQFLDQVNAERQPSAVEGTQAARSRMLWQADNAWVRPISGEVKPPELGAPGHPMSGYTAASASILQKLNEIVFPEIKFRAATITDIIQYLSDESRHLDPKKEGVNIVLSAGVGGGGETVSTPSPVEAGAPAPAPSTGGGITLSLHNVPMIEVLKYITSLANLKYLIESSAVLIVRADQPEGQMITRSYPVNPNVFLSLVAVTNYPTATQRSQQTGGGGGGVAQAAASIQTGPSSVLPDVAIAVDQSNEVRRVFIDAGVQFPTNSSVYYYPRNSTIIIHNTVENIEIFERVLAVLNAPPQQIEIEAKFVEISQTDLDELGFNWKVGGQTFSGGQAGIAGGNPPSTPFTISPGVQPGDENLITGGLRDSTAIQGNAIDALLGGAGLASGANTIGTIRGILTNPQFELIIKALSRKGSTDVLSAPKVTTISGAQAQIRIAQEFIYPTTFSTATVLPGTAAALGGNSTQPVITPSTPGGFASRPVGVVFNVTPTVGADGYTISLTLIPQVTEFLGFIQYGGTLTSGGSSVFNDIRQPLFSTRDVVTSVLIWDGQTVVLGGLIREDVSKIDDKIPFLGDIPFAGRLFRSKVTQRSKRNLLIFVTARLVDPAGNLVHKESLRAGTR